MSLRPLAVAAAASAALPAVPGAAAAHTYTYSVETRGDVQASPGTVARVAARTLSRPEGWALDGNIAFVPVSSGGDFRLVLASPRAVARAHPVCSRMWSCRVGRDILLNDARWRRTTPTWPLSRRAYRSYVLNHELGHWLGLPGRRPCPGTRQAAPMMMQQSKGLGECEANVWPLPGERERLARIRNVTAFSPRRDEGGNGAAEAPAWPGRYLFLKRPFMQGEDVRRYQARMRERGWRASTGRPLAVDGIFGPQTARATRLFQLEKGLSVDGVVGPNTWTGAWEEPVT